MRRWHERQSRRSFLASASAVVASGPRFFTGFAGAAEPTVIQPANSDELQRMLLAHSGKGLTLKIQTPQRLLCRDREEQVHGQKSRHALLVPEGVELDLNGSTLSLEFHENSYGVRLSSKSGIRNGSIKITRSEGKGSQAIWHTAVSVGAAYGDGGIVARPSYFSKVSDWTIADLTIDQPFESAAIQIMSESHRGMIRNIRILDSAKALLGIGLDWGSLGPVMTADKEIPRMRKLFEAGQIQSLHPHDILIENIHVGKLTRNVDGNDAGVRTSACHNIAIRNIDVDSAATAVAVFGGDLGYEFAPPEQRQSAHSGYVLENIRIAHAFKYGLVLNGNADNITRALKDPGYTPLLDPVHPGLVKPTVRNCRLIGAEPKAQGIYAVAVSNGTCEDLTIEKFAIGVHVEDWVRGLRFRRTKFADNLRDTDVAGATEAAKDVMFEG